MSLQAQVWVIENAPTEDPGEFAFLMALANNASEDGTGAYPSMKTAANRARCSVRTAQRIKDELLNRGLLRLGDQQMVAHYPANRRPIVYDLAIELRRDHNPKPQVNRGDNLTPQEPDDPGPGVSENDSGVTEPRSGVTAVAHKPSFKPSLNHPTSEPDPDGMDGDEETPEEQTPAAKLLDALPDPWWTGSGKTRVKLESQVQKILDGGAWTYSALFTELSRDAQNITNPVGVLISRVNAASRRKKRNLSRISTPKAAPVGEGPGWEVAADAARKAAADAARRALKANSRVVAGRFFPVAS